MAVAEIFVAAFITVLFEKLASADFMKLARSEGVDVQLKKWKKTFSQIQLVLADAGQKQISQRSVESWLHDLQDLAYDIDDVLDDLATEAMRRKFNQQSHASTSKVLKFIPTCCINSTPRNIMYGRKMSSKLDDLTTRLDQLVEQTNILLLNENVVPSIRTSNSSMETSLVDESKIIGREEDKEALLGKLLGKEVCIQNVSVVSIIGIGGIGKTTLAKVLYNEKRVTDHFELMAWVYVSEEFDVLKISNAIFQAVGGSNQYSDNLELLHVSLKEKLLNKRFLIVLDDVWNEDHREWELLQSPFVAGAPGSKIIVTTRKTKVASVMNSSQFHDLDVLSEEKVLSLFAQNALKEQNFDKHPTLKVYGEAIVKKCGRLPLALITLGRVLRTKTNDDEWEEVLNSEIWNLQDVNHILPSLRLSYYDLPPHLKQLFVYCSLFPKGSLYEKNGLVLLWMAEGLLNQSNDIKSSESFGREYFEELRSRSFFQTSAFGRHIMHDLINDLATSVAREFFCRLDDKIDVHNNYEGFEKVRHLSFMGQQCVIHRKFKELERARCIRTFLPAYLDSSTLTGELLPDLQFLRVLCLTNFSITEIPQMIGSFKHMRYLNFSSTNITCLPEQLSDLYNLQSLLVSHCLKLSSLHVSFVKLLNMRHLDTSYTPMLNKMPLGLGGLTSLQTLRKVIIEGDNGFKISELKDLSNLQGSLSIMGLEKVMTREQAKDAYLQQKKGLDDLEMEWSDVFSHPRDPTTEYEVLEGLRPHHKLRTLKILFYGGVEFPSWVGNPSLDRLTSLTLSGCKNCTHLLTLGHLPSIKELYVTNMDEMKTLGFELLTTTNSFHHVAFPSLELLDITTVKGWERCSLSGGANDGAARSFPRLHQIIVSDCPKLSQVSIDLIPSLEELYILACLKLVLLEEKEVNLGISTESGRKVPLDNCETLGSYNCPNNIKSLYISECDSMASLTFPTVEDLPSSMKSLSVDSCNNLEDRWLSNNFLSSLESLNISNCDRMRWFPEGCFVHLITLNIKDCDNIEFIPKEGFGFHPLFCLKYLEISGCKNLKSFPHEHMKSLTSLEELVITNCPNMNYSFPSGWWPPNLRILGIGCLNKPMSKWGVQNYPMSLVELELYGKKSGVVSFAEPEDVRNNNNTSTTSSFLLPPSLASLKIIGFEDLEFISKGLQHLLCLENLDITSCPKVSDLPKTTSTGSALRITGQGLPAHYLPRIPSAPKFIALM